MCRLTAKSYLPKAEASEVINWKEHSNSNFDDWQIKSKLHQETEKFLRTTILGRAPYFHEFYLYTTLPGSHCEEPRKTPLQLRHRQGENKHCKTTRTLYITKVYYLYWRPGPSSFPMGLGSGGKADANIHFEG